MRNKKLFRISLAGILSISMLGSVPAMAAEFSAEDVSAAVVSEEELPGMLAAEDPAEITEEEIQELTQVAEEEGIEAEAVPTAVETAINETNFPDDVFRSYVSVAFDTNSDGKLSVAEINKVKDIEVYNMGITDLTGVGTFVGATTLLCQGNKLATLDLSRLLYLETLNCSNNNLTSIKVSATNGLPKLAWANISNNRLTAQPIPLEMYSGMNIDTDHYGGSSVLTYLNCSNNLITALNTGYMSGELDASNNRLTSVTGGDQGFLCDKLYVEGNSTLKTLDLTGIMDHVPSVLSRDAACKVTLVKAPTITYNVRTVNYRTNRFYYVKTNFWAGYQIQRYDSKTKAWKTLKIDEAPAEELDSNTTAAYYDDNTALPGISYKYRVRAFVRVKDRSGKSSVYASAYAPAAGKAAYVMPAATTSVKATAGTKQITVSWARCSATNGYQIFRYTSAANAKANKSPKYVGRVTSATTLKWVDKSVPSGTAYYYRVRPYRNLYGTIMAGPLSSVYAGARAK